jgi:hypothetical protein
MTKCDSQFELSSLHPPSIPQSGGTEARLSQFVPGMRPLLFTAHSHMQVLMSGEPVKSFKIVPTSLPYTCPSTPTTRGKAIEEAQRYSVGHQNFQPPVRGRLQINVRAREKFPTDGIFCTGMGATLMKAASFTNA